DGHKRRRVKVASRPAPIVSTLDSTPASIKDAPDRFGHSVMRSVFCIGRMLSHHTAEVQTSYGGTCRNFHAIVWMPIYHERFIRRLHDPRSNFKHIFLSHGHSFVFGRWNIVCCQGRIYYEESNVKFFIDMLTGCKVPATSMPSNVTKSMERFAFSVLIDFLS
ncbi:hypothetical protein OSTOST_15984, partial [Ostertagia ostertagi]